MKAYIRENLAYAQHFLEEQIPQVKTVKPEGTYLLWVDFRSLGLSGKELEDLIVKKAGLWLDSGDIFGAAGRGFADQCGMSAQRADGSTGAARACSAGMCQMTDCV